MQLNSPRLILNFPRISGGNSKGLLLEEVHKTALGEYAKGFSAKALFSRKCAKQDALNLSKCRVGISDDIQPDTITDDDFLSVIGGELSVRKLRTNIFSDLRVSYLILQMNYILKFKKSGLIDPQSENDNYRRRVGCVFPMVVSFKDTLEPKFLSDWGKDDFGSPFADDCFKDIRIDKLKADTFRDGKPISLKLRIYSPEFRQAYLELLMEMLKKMVTDGRLSPHPTTAGVADRFTEIYKEKFVEVNVKGRKRGIAEVETDVRDILLDFLERHTEPRAANEHAYVRLEDLLKVLNKEISPTLDDDMFRDQLMFFLRVLSKVYFSF